MRTALAFTNKDGDEIKVSLHPISLVLIAVELIEDAANAACRRKGHDPDESNHCHRCGVSLPDTSPYGSWLRETYRSFTKRARS